MEVRWSFSAKNIRSKVFLVQKDIEKFPNDVNNTSRTVARAVEIKGEGIDISCSVKCIIRPGFDPNTKLEHCSLGGYKEIFMV